MRNKGRFMGKEMIIEGPGLKVAYNPDNFSLRIETGCKIWAQCSSFQPYMDIYEGEKPIRVYFKDAKDISHECYRTGTGEGIKSVFREFEIDRKILPVSFEILIWVDCFYGDLHFEFVPITDTHGCVKRVVWPGPLEFNKQSECNYTVLPIMQGALIPNNWEQEIESEKLVNMGDGKCYTRSLYMQWWGQIEENNGYIAIVETPWEGGYILNHPSGGPTNISAAWYPSLGRLDYIRKIKYTFLKDCDYNTLCKVYRNYIRQKGAFVTFEEKILKNPNTVHLLGCPIIHTFIYNHVEPASFYFDKDHPEKNDELVSFENRIEQIKRLKNLGVDKAFLHVDGWGKRGYDNLHPDIFPPCEQAGGWDGIKNLADSCEHLGYLFATHDQYRDYYTDAETFNKEQAVKDINGEVQLSSIWAGGEQALLCARNAPDYVRRNFERLKNNGIMLKGTYLDVFSVVELDECFHKEHRMTRKECMESRKECFEYVRSQGIIISSEETIDWSVACLDLAHHSPYALTPSMEGGDAIGIPVPLFNLVYHECMVIPWFLTKGASGIPDSDSGFLHALLNGGTGYLDIEAGGDEIDRIKIVCGLHEKVGKLELLEHKFIDNNTRKQRSCFADGTIVEVDFGNDTYSIKLGTYQL
jgi:hypothetical protein